MDDQSGSASPKADWYADPAGRHQFRYWDGLTWTDSVADDGEQSADPLSPAPPQGVSAQPSGVCESCQASISSVRRSFFTGTRGDTRAAGMQREVSYSVAQRSQVVLCEQCFKSPQKRQVAISRKMASSGRQGDTWWIELPREFVLQWLRNTSYVRIRDVMQDELAGPTAADDASVVFHWKGRRYAADGPVCIAVDGIVDGWGSFHRGFTAQVRVAAGTHSVYAKAGIVTPKDSGQQVLVVASGAEYTAEIAQSAWAQTLLEITRTK